MSSLPSITARDFMTADIVSVSPAMDVMAAMRQFCAHRISGAPVIDERGNLVGILTERDCINAIVVAGYHGECSCGAVAKFMSSDVTSVDAQTSLFDVAHLFVTTVYRRFPVVDEGRVVGVISRGDIIRALLKLG